MYMWDNTNISVSFQYVKIVLSKNLNIICVKNCCSGQLSVDVQAVIKHCSISFSFSKALKGVGVFCGVTLWLRPCGLQTGHSSESCVCVSGLPHFVL